MEDAGDGVYRPPKIASAMFTGDESARDKAEKELEQKKRRLKKSEMLRSMREELTDAPVEVGGYHDDANFRKARAA